MKRLLYGSLVITAAVVASNDEAAVYSQAPTPVLSPLSSADIAHSKLSGLGCDFRANGHVYLVIALGGALLKLDGTVLSFAIDEDRSLAVINYGGVFGNSQVRVTVDRDDKILQAGEEGVVRKARLTVRRHDQTSTLIGNWNCGA